MAGAAHAKKLHPGIDPHVIAQGILVPRTPAELRKLAGDRRVKISHPIKFVDAQTIRRVMDREGSIHPGKVHPEDYRNFHPDFMPVELHAMINPLNMEKVLTHLLRNKKDLPKEELEAFARLNNANAMVNYNAERIAFWSYRLTGHVTNPGWPEHHVRKERRKWILGITNLRLALFGTGQKTGKISEHDKHAAEEALTKAVEDYTAAKKDLEEHHKQYEALREKYGPVFDEAINSLKQPPAKA